MSICVVASTYDVFVRDFDKTNNSRTFVLLSVWLAVAERRGFEPLKRFGRLLAFQAGQFNHSCIFPLLRVQIYDYFSYKAIVSADLYLTVCHILPTRVAGMPQILRH